MNRRHMIGDHYGRTPGEQLCWSRPRTRFSAHTALFLHARVSLDVALGPGYRATVDALAPSGASHSAAGDCGVFGIAFRPAADTGKAPYHRLLCQLWLPDLNRWPRSVLMP